MVGAVNVRESLCTWVIIWVNIILIHIGTRMILLSYEGSIMVHRPEWFQKQKYR